MCNLTSLFVRLLLAQEGRREKEKRARRGREKGGRREREREGRKEGGRDRRGSALASIWMLIRNANNIPPASSSKK